MTRAAGGTSRRGRPRDDDLAARRREAILETATRIFSQRGFRNTDVDEIAAAAGVGKGTVYRYFPGKRALFLAAVDMGMQRLQARLDEATQGDSQPPDDLGAAMRRSIEAQMQFFEHNPDVVELLIQERAEFKDRKEPSFIAYVNRNKRRWRHVGDTLRAQGRVRDVPPQEMHDFLTQVVYGAIFVNHFKGQRGNIRKQVRRMVDIVLHGVLTETERNRHVPPS